jgi:hypothetical protein
MNQELEWLHFVPFSIEAFLNTWILENLFNQVNFRGKHNFPFSIFRTCVHTGTRCLYEKLDPSNYESGARMVAFRTFHERIVPWIKILNLYYYELMGKQNDKTLFCKMDCISGFSKFIDIVSKLFSTRGYLKTYLTRLISVENTPGQKLQSIIIDVKNVNEERQYKITFFVRSGLIQAQGNHYHEFATKDFPALLYISLSRV